MKAKHTFFAAVNLITFLFLFALIATPFYFAKNTAEVAGAKSKSNYLLISQLENFPNISSQQTGKTYKITINKLPNPSLFTEIFIINNPTNTHRTYEIKSEGGLIFFGNSPRDIKPTITLAPQTSVPLSAFDDSSSAHTLISFEIVEK